MPDSIDAIIDRQLVQWEHGRTAGELAATATAAPPLPLLTVSREHGSNGGAIAARLAEHFGCTLLRRDALDRLATSAYASRLLQSLDEDSRSRMGAWFDSVMGGVHADSITAVRALFTTLFALARLGGVVVVGRGASFVLGLERGFHVRIIAQREHRIRTIAERRGVSLREAAREIANRDHDRAEFVRRLFHRSVDDPLAYDATVNSTGASPEAITEWLAAAAQQKFERLRP
jgi:cytidylate kinase